jgi:hypothetical protein
MKHIESSPDVLLSIVIATHNRANYAVHAIKSILSINSRSLELVVHDTSTNDLLLIDVQPFLTDCRLHYQHCADRLSMTENHNRALAMARGEYVCVIGDDDTVSFEVIDAVEWASRNNIDAISPNVVANYAWPDFRSKTFGAGHSSRIYINKFSCDVAFISTEAGLKDALETACQGTDGLPKIYHGIVKRSVMERIRSEAGNYFFGVSPDVSGALAIALMTKSFAEVDYPLTIPGAAGNSNTGRSAMNAHRGKLEDDPHIKPYKDLVWPELIPKFFSVETVWGQAAYETLGKLDASRLDSFNFIALYSTCLVNHPDYRSEIFKALTVYKNAFHLTAASVYGRLAWSVMKLVIAKTSRLAKRALKPTAAGGRFFVPNIENVFEAGGALKTFLDQKGISFRSGLKPPGPDS